MRVRIIKDRPYRKGQVLNLPRIEALKLIGNGSAIFTKDMVDSEFKTKSSVRASMES